MELDYLSVYPSIHIRWFGNSQTVNCQLLQNWNNTADIPDNPVRHEEQQGAAVLPGPRGHTAPPWRKA